MKTILYQPLFINPQAYFVFPQLYHIEKGDSYIEPANITGQLIINDLTKVLTSTPTLNVVQDTNQVDFGLFKGKHIRISQYTNIGAVVLGEWYIPGTPTPPEPEQPDWFKESIVAWYSPYCKQRMTNFDVIESYAEDFTSNNWKHTNNVTVTNNSFHLTYGDLRYELYPNTTYNTKPMTVIVKGMAGIIGFIRYRYGANKNYVDINKDGVYYLPAKVDDVTVLGFQTHFKSECNITITQLPTSILKDFSGNGNHAYLYGGKGKLNSGMGVYNNDFTDSGRANFTWIYTTGDITVNGADSFTIHNNREKWVFRCTTNVKPMTVKIVGVSNDINFKYRYESANGEKWIFFKKDGIYELPATIGTWQGFNLEKNNDIDVNITVTQIPDYPDQLCYDGKMYAVCYGFPILTDYTVMAERTILDNSDIADWAFIAKRDYPAINGAFTFEKDIDDTSDNLRTISFGRTSVIYKPIKERSISYQTKNKYNGQDIIVGNVDDVDFLLIGAGILDTNLNLVKEKMRVAHGNILLFNRSLTEYEISWVKNNMMCSKQQEPDIDL